jgi:hypothetical protein
LVEFRIPASQKDAKIDAFGVIIEFATVNGETRRARKRARKAVFVEEMPYVECNTGLDGLAAPFVRDEHFDLGERFEDEAGVEVVDEIPDAIRSIEPRSVGLLRPEHEI